MTEERPEHEKVLIKAIYRAQHARWPQHISDHVKKLEAIIAEREEEISELKGYLNV